MTEAPAAPSPNARRTRRPIRNPAAKTARASTASASPPDDEPITFETGSGNVFEDLGLPDATNEAIKARLVMRLRAEMDRRGLNQTEFAALLGVKQPDVSNLVRGRVLGFSLERMLDFTRALGDEVEITLRPSKVERQGRMSLKVA
ncbi:helix-turn-helix domain-containing protein [Methylobacterium sp. E-016]|uniref:helix-turn-helix domain-containing protein n=1 Tax=Methylobacterium sp. E-016 TaxID=2836556 RepID=UPI001FBA4073|nr:helix-turn-helix transcriptional regulator [Methylobacterium sp. E-016]MCJ2074793.1 helix-turn-helix domain-containing protein [Methylobacterium sp. E-016]